MKLKLFSIRLPIMAFAILVMAVGCSSSGSLAPVVEKKAQHEFESGVKVKKLAIPDGGQTAKGVSRAKDGSLQTYVVQKGDTLYTIAFSYGLDYRDIAELNNIQNHDLIQAGQELRLPSAASPAVSTIPGTPIAPVVAMNMVESRPLQSSTVTQQKVTSLPYSGQVVTGAEKVPEVYKPETAQSSKDQTRYVSRSEPKPNYAAEEENAVLEWIMPTSGKIINEFSEISGSKGINIAGKLGQPIVASSAGKVVYSGNGLRGYGKLLIIKHNKEYLSAYAHNDQLLVKEGQNVSRGQKIAEMGNTDADQVILHFEIRRYGKPVDPARYLSITKS